MKQLTQYIQEKLHVSDYKKNYSYKPRNKTELKKILKERLSINEDANLNDIDVSNIKDMKYLFGKTFPYNIDISKWNVSNVTDMSFMFFDCDHFNSDLSNWDVSNVENMEQMFSGCKSFEGKGLENWNVSKVKNKNYIFYECNSIVKKPSWW